MQIRPATAEDTRTIYGFLCDLEEQLFDLEVFKAIFLKNLQNPDCHYFLAFDGLTPVGYASLHAQWLLHHCGKVGEIQEMYVLASHRGRGIGKILLAQLMEVAEREQLEVIEVTANQKRHDTHRFYEANGLQKTHFKFVKPMEQGR
jgi:(aminoalkyl)phosphonate N-acetyltransferase